MTIEETLETARDASTTRKHEAQVWLGGPKPHNKTARNARWGLPGKHIGEAPSLESWFHLKQFCICEPHAGGAPWHPPRPDSVLRFVQTPSLASAGNDTSLLYCAGHARKYLLYGVFTCHGPKCPDVEITSLEARPGQSLRARVTKVANERAQLGNYSPGHRREVVHQSTPPAATALVFIQIKSQT